MLCENRVTRQLTKKQFYTLIANLCRRPNERATWILCLMRQARRISRFPDQRRDGNGDRDQECPVPHRNLVSWYPLSLPPPRAMRPVRSVRSVRAMGTVRTVLCDHRIGCRPMENECLLIGCDRCWVRGRKGTSFARLQLDSIQDRRGGCVANVRHQRRNRNS